jgi:uncharacterized membrane protein (DUF2068 family)
MGSMVQGRAAPVTRHHDHTLHALRSIASLELAKGLIVLFAAIAILFLMHRDLWDVADGLLHLLHISPDGHFAQRFLDWADTLTQAKLWLVAGGALAYSILRFFEAYGLWYARAWAEWIALVSGSLYLPYEIYKVVHRQNLFHISVLLINLVIVFYMAYLLKAGKSPYGTPGENLT